MRDDDEDGKLGVYGVESPGWERGSKVDEVEDDWVLERDGMLSGGGNRGGAGKNHSGRSAVGELSSKSGTSGTGGCRVKAKGHRGTRVSHICLSPRGVGSWRGSGGLSSD